jgi:hypothetical protein
VTTTRLHSLSAAAAADTPVPIRKRAAILFFGHTGAISYEQFDKKIMTTEAVRVAWPTIQRHVIEANRGAGWGVDVFFHTWTAEAESELVELLQPRAHSVARPSRTYTHKFIPANGGIHVSIEHALRTMARSVLPDNLKAYVGDDSGDGAAVWRGVEDSGNDNTTTDAHSAHRREVEAAMASAYDRVLLLRFDLVFFRPLLFDKLAEDDAYYVANWCKATGKTFAQSLGELDQLFGPPVHDAATALIPEGTDPGLCKQLVSFAEHAVVGIPDLYQAGTWPVLWRMYNGMADDLERGRFHPTSSSNNHAVLGGRVQHMGIKVRRYLYHEADFTIVRNALSCAASSTSPPDSLCSSARQSHDHRWINRGDDEPSEGTAVLGCCSSWNEKLHENCD